MNQKVNYEIQSAGVVVNIIGLDEANNSNRHDHKDFDCTCHECIQDKQYLIWELEA